MNVGRCRYQSIVNLTFHGHINISEVAGLAFNFIVIMCLLLPAARVTASTDSVFAGLRQLQDKVDSHDEVLRRMRAREGGDQGGETPRHMEREQEGQIRLMSIQALLLNAESEDMGFRTTPYPNTFTRLSQTCITLISECPLIDACTLQVRLWILSL